jgi:hypothetical protein
LLWPPLKTKPFLQQAFGLKKFQASRSVNMSTLSNETHRQIGCLLVIQVRM